MLCFYFASGTGSWPAKETQQLSFGQDKMVSTPIEPSLDLIQSQTTSTESLEHISSLEYSRLHLEMCHLPAWNGVSGSKMRVTTVMDKSKGKMTPKTS